MFQGKVVVITGAASGIGLATAARFAAMGAQVACCDLPEADQAALAQQLPQARFYGLDVRNAKSVSAVLGDITLALGAPDILVNSAGIREICHPLDLDPLEWSRVLDVNLTGSFLMAQGVAKALRAAGKGGAIVNVASTAGLIASRDRAAYVASKHGVVGLTRQLAWDLGREGIRVNAVAPAVTRTAMTAGYFNDPVRAAEIISNYPLGRVGEAEDVAKAITFLASEDASFISGIVLPVDGGTSAGKR